MTFINYASREINCKIVYYGPGLCGKTTNLQHIYDKTNPQAKGKLISLATETDRKTIVAGLKLCRRILAHPHMQNFIEAEFQPGPEVESDEELLDYARRRGGTVYHPTSTCKMGSDPMAVVDAELRVHGIDGLRIADASIMPTVVSGNTNAATIMIGEKLADMVRQPLRMAA